LVFPFLTSLFASSKTLLVVKNVNRIYNFLVLLVYQLISLGELQLYGEWKTKLSAKAVTYLKEPAEVIGSATNSGIVISVVLLVILLAFFVFVYNKLVFKIELKPFKFLSIKSISYILIMSFGLFYGMRGGLQAIPITASQAYFSKHDILNITAVNSAYYMMFSIMDYQSINSQNIFKTIDEKQALDLVRQMHEVEKDTTISILNNPRPNIVIVLLESWSGDMIESLGGDAGFTPEFRKLESEGLLFTEFYATANRSQQAMASIYSGLPGLPVTTLTNHPEKYPSVSSLVKTLNKEGYYSSFTFGGKLIYGNMKSYLSDNRFDLIVEQDDIKANGPLGKLGFHDEFMFDYFENQINEMQQPFFANLFSLSSHSPYDFPGDRKFDNINLEQDFVNSIYYSDEQLGKFFEKAEKSDYWENTLFIVLADHSHNSNKNHPVQSFEYHKIPLLITGGALREEFRGEQNSKLCSNVDLTSTLLHQLQLPSDDFFWSKNIFNPYSPEFAYFELNSGFGWKRNYGEQVMNIKDNYYFLRSVPDDKKEKLDKEGKAYLQVLFDEFMEY
jgi:phosphoglycerol transferase MdoB-like AlkP superfamily enzyme